MSKKAVVKQQAPKFDEGKLITALVGFISEHPDYDYSAILAALPPGTVDEIVWQLADDAGENAPNQLAMTVCHIISNHLDIALTRHAEPKS